MTGTLDPRLPRRTLILTSIVVFMVSLEITIIALAFPEIEAAFPDSSPRQLSWVITAYNIGVASFLLLAGWWADATGRRRVFALGLVLFGLGSLLATLAWSGPVLIAARVVQSIGGAVQYPAGLALLLEAYPIERRQSAIGIWAGMGALAAALGPSLGGLLVDAFGWRSIFAINVPVAMAAAALAPGWLAESTGGKSEGRVDVLSVPLASIGIGSILLGIVQAEEWGVGSAAVASSVTIGVVLVAVFLIRSRRHPAPLLDLDLFRIRSYTVGNVGGIAFTVAFFAWLVTLPSFLQDAWGWSIRQTGFAIAPAPFLSMFLSPLAGRLGDRIGSRPLLLVSGACGAAGLLLQRATAGEDPAFVAGVLLPGVLVGIAAGTGFPMVVAAVMRDVPPRQFGMAGAARTTIFQLSIAIGVAIGFALAEGELAGYVERIHRLWLVGAGFFIAQFLVFAVAFRDPRPGAVGAVR